MIEIPPHIQEIIDSETQKDIAPILEADPESAGIGREIFTDYRESTYHFLMWLDKQLSLRSVLYPLSGHDVMPKAILGDDRVIHTSPETPPPQSYSLVRSASKIMQYIKYPSLIGRKYADDPRLYRGTHDNYQFFPGLGSGLKVIASTDLPFKDGSMDATLLFNAASVRNGSREYARVTRPGGVVVVRHFSMDEDSFGDNLRMVSRLPSLVPMDIPEDLQLQGSSETQFYLFRRI